MKHKSLKWQRPMGLWEVECLSAGKIMEIEFQSPLDFNEVDKLILHITILFVWIS